MKKHISHKTKWFSDINLNWDAVRSFISDVKAKDKIPEQIKKVAFAPKQNNEKETVKQTNIPTPIKSISSGKSHSDSKSSHLSSNNVPSNKKKDESIYDIVKELKSFNTKKKGLGISAIARVHCLYDAKVETFWFTNILYHPRDLYPLRDFGRFVPKYSDVALKMQKSDVGFSFEYVGINNIKRQQKHHVFLVNQANLQDQTISIYGDSLKYQYRSLDDFLKALSQNKEDIIDIESKISELEKQRLYDLDPQTKRHITISINKYKEEYRILTQQQEDLKNITIYIRKQGEMRYSYIVDPIQTAIMEKHLYDGTTVVIKGGPGTGKTTTMIHRLAYLTNSFALDEDEKNKLNKFKLLPLQRKQLREAIKANRDWMFFSPSQMLKDYLANAMTQEGLSHTSEKVWNWRDYCRIILQEYYNLLESKNNKAPFKVCYLDKTLFYQESDISNVFTSFILDQLREITTVPLKWTNRSLK